MKVGYVRVSSQGQNTARQEVLPGGYKRPGSGTKPAADTQRLSAQALRKRHSDRIHRSMHSEKDRG